MVVFSAIMREEELRFWFEKEMDQRKLDFLFLGVESGKTSVVCCIYIAKRNLKCKTQFSVVL